MGQLLEDLMFGGHLIEVIIILVIALVFLGPKRLPEAGSSIGKAIREFRHETQGEADEVPDSVEEAQPSQDSRRRSQPDAGLTRPDSQPVATPARSADTDEHVHERTHT
jgi:sec-independent protein translocase protein TatA